MASNVPLVRQTAWISLFPQLLFCGLLISGYYFAGQQEFFLFGTLTYLAVSISLRYLVPRSHRQGIDLVKQKNFEAAIPLFERSYNFFSKNQWIDRHRYLTLLSSSKMCYREMALVNIAFCYGQIGNADKSIEYYNRILTEFPSNGIAIAALNFLNGISGVEK